MPNFPTSLDTSSNLPNPAGTDLLDNANPNLDHDYQHTTVNEAVIAIEEKLGIDGSADVSSIDYLLKNASSSNPGHKHTLSSLSDFNVSSPLDEQVLRYNNGSGKWENVTISVDVTIGNVVAGGTAGRVLFIDGSGNLDDNAEFLWDDANNRLGIGDAPSFRFDVSLTSLGATTGSTNGGRLINTTAAALGAQQYSPFLQLSGKGWSTGSSASQAVDFRLVTVPIQGSTPTGELAILSSINGGAWTNRFSIRSAGGFRVAGPGTAIIDVSGTDLIQFKENGNSTAMTLDATNRLLILSPASTPGADPSSGGEFWNDSTTGGMRYRTGTTNEGGGVNNSIHNRGTTTTGAGTNYSLTNALAVVTFGTTSPSVSLPTQGTYYVFGTASFTADAITAIGDVFEAQLYNNTDAAAIGTTHQMTATILSEVFELNMAHIVTITASKTLTIRAQNATAARGTITSTKTYVGFIRMH